jgi:arylformamidase
MTGPKVYLDYDQEALDAAYNQAAYAPNMDALNLRRRQLSAEARRYLPTALRLAYGPTEIEQMDVFQVTRDNAPIVVFLHGGAWRAQTATNYSFLAEPFLAHGAHFVAPDFIPVTDAAGDLFAMVDQVRRAVAWVHQNAASFGGDASRIYLGGHSSGSHLGSCVLMTDWQRDFGLPADVVKAAALCSGMYDLYPVSLSARSGYVAFTERMIEELSAIRHLDRITAPTIVAHGTNETPEFQRQARDFAAAAQQAGCPVELLIGEGYNHFEIMETFASPYGICGRAALRLFGLTTALA